FARAGIETAAWDLEAHRRGTGLPQLVAERLGVAPAASFPCGVALGIPEDRRAETLTRRVYEALQHGYQRVKIKVAPQWDDIAVRAARAGMAGTDVPLTVDANGAYRWPEHEAALRALDEAGLLYIEQPLAPDELVGHARLARALKTPLCLDETLRDAGSARQILALEGPMVWNLKVHRVGGLAEACRICRIAAECVAQLWAGTMPESDAPLKDLPSRAAQRFKRAREGIRALRHVTEQVVFMGTAWKWVWMYEVGGRKLGYLHPMETGLSGTFILTETEERELVVTD